MSDLHAWSVWRRDYSRGRWSPFYGEWKRASSHKTRVAAEVKAKRELGGVLRRTSEGPPP